MKKVCYFRFGNPAGYVLHEHSRHFYQAFLIAIGPFIIGTILAILSFMLSMTEKFSDDRYILIWLGFSISANCFPSRGDAQSLWIENCTHFKNNIFAILGLPLAAIVWMISRLDCQWISILYTGFLFYLARLF